MPQCWFLKCRLSDHCKEVYPSGYPPCAPNTEVATPSASCNSSSHKMPSYSEVYSEWCAVNDNAPKNSDARVLFHEIYHIIARHFGH